MHPHGEYTINVNDNVIHVYPKGGFNAQGIQALRKDIVELIPKDKPWALFEHPQGEAGLTPDAIDSIIQSYTLFEALHCQAIALEISQTWRGVFQSAIVDSVSIPILLDNDEQKLTALLDNLLK